MRLAPLIPAKAGIQLNRCPETPLSRGRPENKSGSGGSARRLSAWLRAAALLIGLGVATAVQAEEDGKISNPVAEFTGLDKITGRVITFDVLVDETVQFGALQVTPRMCYSRPPTEAPRTTVFVEVDEVTLDNEIRRIFNGWMFADSPGLNAVEHPIYDVWLTNCKMESEEVDVGSR